MNGWQHHLTRAAVRRNDNLQNMITQNKENDTNFDGLLQAMAITTVTDPATTDLEDPASLKEAMESTEWPLWKQAIEEEWNSLILNKTWETFIPAPNEDDHIRPLSSKIVFKRKWNANNTVRYKARIVVRGCEQIRGIDYKETYAPVSKITTLRLILSMAARRGWKINHLDVITAFLNPTVDQNNIIVRLPRVKGIEGIGTSSIVRLRKALYGLRQSPRLWFLDINNFLLSLGLNQSHYDPNLYMKEGILILLYVDDILIIQTDGTDVSAHIKTKIQEKYKMTDLGEVHQFLGFEIIHTAEGIFVSQRHYLEQLVIRYEMQDAVPASTPLDPHVRLDNPNCADKPLDDKQKMLFQSIVGSIMYAAMGTRPDLAFAASTLSRFLTNPLSMHLTAAKQVIRYVKGTVNLSLFYSSDTAHSDKISGYTDSDWAGSLKDRKSVSGHIFFSGDAPVSWQSKKQSVVALSTLEAEFVAASNATREALWVGKLVTEITNRTSLKLPPKSSEPIKILCDNQGALKLIHTGVAKAQTRHIDVKFHHSIDEERKGNVHFDYVKTAENTADLLTKGLAGPAHHAMLERCGLRTRPTYFVDDLPTPMELNE